jgi:predicted Zn-dependent protease
MKSIKFILILAGLLAVVPAHTQSSGDEIIFKAMNDELRRSMNKLIFDSYQPPFFIAYHLYDNKVMTIKASLGSILQSKTDSSRSDYMRLMVGNYTLNDENFEGGRHSNYSTSYSPVPLEDDYYGIRQAFWSMTDKVYKSATETYEQKKAALKLQNKIGERLDDYSRIIPIQKTSTDVSFDMDRNRWEDVAKELSATIRQYPQVISSYVIVHFIKSWVYVTTSEGTQVKIPANIAAILADVATLAPDGEQLYDRIQFIAPVPDKLPSAAEMKDEIKRQVDKLIALSAASYPDETYNGPVVFEGQALSELISQNLFGNEKLISQRDPDYADGSESSGANPDLKIDKKICDENITIKAIASMQHYNNLSLVGTFGIDAEGVAPPDELTLIDEGKLKTQLNDRVPTELVKESNGYSRLALYSEGVASPQKAPGVVSFDFKDGKKIEAVYKAALKAAKKQGLDYYYIIRKLSDNNPVQIYKVSVKTGNEQMVRKALLRNFEFSNFKHVLAASKEQFAINQLLSSGSAFVPVSYILPKAMAFDNINIDKDKGAKQKLPVVPNPFSEK